MSGRPPTVYDSSEPDDEAFADAGFFDPLWVVLTFGVAVPAALLLLAALMAWLQAVPTPGRHFGSTLELEWMEGWSVVGGFALVAMGAALVGVTRFLLPNVRRDCYSYQYPAAAGVVLLGLGVLLLLLAAAGVGARSA